MEAADDLEELGIQGVSQDTLVNELEASAQSFITLKSYQQEVSRLERYTQKLMVVRSQKSKLKIEIENATRISARSGLKTKLARVEEDETGVLADLRDIKARVKSLKNELAQKPERAGAGGGVRKDNESEKAYLIRTGKVTAFGNEAEFSLENGEAIKLEEHAPLPTDRAPDDSSEYDEGDDSQTGFSDDASSEGELERDELGVESVDDGLESNYTKRLRSWISMRSAGRPGDGSSDVPEWELPHPELASAKLNSEFRIPGEIFNKLFTYQKTCVQWLYELYQQQHGGIIGDEMGLGKTIQLIAFLASLHHSGLLKGPVLLLCPATVLRQWCEEFHKWWPPFRTIILHSIGSGMSGNNLVSEQELEEQLLNSNDESAYEKYLNLSSTRKKMESSYNVRKLIDRVENHGHILITTYVGLKIHAKELLSVNWSYAVLDEGHKIRNPDADITLTCKKIKTYNRVILSGTPIQNNLTELWSLFDFIFPGKLGTLPVFQKQFAGPINIGGYANATNIQVQTGYECAVALRDLISPYLLRRVKSDVARDLPKKHEMVLFCKMTQIQRQKYLQFLNSDDLVKIRSGRKQVLFGIDILRKICNHPDLLERDFKKDDAHYGDPKRSGKVLVVIKLLQMWHKQKHKTLLFTQSRQMLDILERCFSPQGSLSELQYLKMDGTTDIGKRQALINRFNDEPYDVFILTTRVGGLGVNLTGANRIIIFDPDWNPSTDLQARERAWRIGQKREVVIYRLMVSGTIEEKIYHRQIFKQFLTNKVLSDSKQKRFFKMNELHDLFTLGGENVGGSEEFVEEVSKQTAELRKSSSTNTDFNDIINMAGVSKLEGYYNTKEKEKASKTDDDRIMDSIFGGSVDANPNESEGTPNPHKQDIISKEAASLAQKAVDSLKKSRILTRKHTVGTPTWTGRYGVAGRIKKKRTGPTAASKDANRIHKPK